MGHFVPPGPLGMGGAPLGNLLSVVPEPDARAALDAAWDASIRYYDTAPYYGFGLSEHRMGAMLRRPSGDGRGDPRRTQRGGDDGKRHADGNPGPGGTLAGTPRCKSHPATRADTPIV